MRFALTVRPKNYLLFTCHLSNTILQFNLLSRRLGYEWDRYQRGLPIGSLTEEEKAAKKAAEEIKEVAALK